MLVFLQIAFGTAALGLAILVKTQWLGIGALAVVCGSAVLRAVVSRFDTWSLAFAIGGTIAFPLTCVFGTAPFTWDNYFAAMSWLVGSATILAVCGKEARQSGPWRALSFLWWLWGCSIVCATAYERNEPGAFYAGLAAAGVLVVIAKRAIEFGTIGHQAANTFLLLVLGLPIADRFTHPAYLLDSSPEPSKKYYSFEGARKDPSAFRRWWTYYLTEWGAMGVRVYMPDPAGILPFRLRPGSEGKMFNSRVAINKLGFRGKEISREKGDAYRIVILGESTTFGATMNREDRPWPEVLEAIIQERLKPSRPVEVINAGVPTYTIVHNLSRLSSDILPLKPDLLMCYHGYNGFFLLRGSVPPAHGEHPPPYVERPVKLFANLEYNLKIRRFKRQLAGKPQHEFSGSPLDTPYAKAYEQLIQVGQTNGARVAIANFSMAVVPGSPREVIEFYRAAFPSVYWQMEANRTHTEVVKELAARYPQMIPVDMHPGLDGEHEKFVDLVHMTQEGRQQAAENAFAAIKPVLEPDLK